MFIKKRSTRRHARKHEALLSLASRLITLVTPDFLTGKCPPVSFKAESQHKLSTRPGIPEADVARAFQTFLQSEHRLVAFSNISSDISSGWAHESTSLNVNKATGMLTTHAKRTSGSLSSASVLHQSSPLLACKAPRAQLSICFPTSLSHIHLAASLLCPADCF